MGLSEQDLVGMSTETGLNNAQISLNRALKENFLRVVEFLQTNKDVSSSVQAATVSLRNEIESIKPFSFNNYEYDYFYKEIYAFSSSETWTAAGSTTVANNTSDYIAGSQSKDFTSSGTGNWAIEAYNSDAKDLSYFGSSAFPSLDNDYITLIFKIDDIALFDDHSTESFALKFVFSTHASTRTSETASYGVALSELIEGWNRVKIKKSEFTLSSFAGWDSVTFLSIYATTNDTAALISFNISNLLTAMEQPYFLIDSADLTNTDESVQEATADSLYLNDSNNKNRFLNKSIDFYTTYLQFKNDVAGAKNEVYKVAGISRNQVDTIDNANYPEILNDVAWNLLHPVFLSNTEDHLFYTKEQHLYITTINRDVASDSFLEFNLFKPTNPDLKFSLFASFNINADVENQGFYIYYKDSDNYVRAYIHYNGASSSFKVDKVISGTPENIFTSDTFTLTTSDYVNFGLHIYYNNVSIYAGIGTSFLDCYCNEQINIFDASLVNYQAFCGLYASKALDLDYNSIEVKENNSKNPFDATSNNFDQVPLTSNATITYKYKDKLVQLDSSGGSFTITLNSSKMLPGWECDFKDVTGNCTDNKIILDGSGNNIDNSTGYDIASDWGHIKVQWNGSKFLIKSYDENGLNIQDGVYKWRKNFALGSGSAGLYFKVATITVAAQFQGCVLQGRAIMTAGTDDWATQSEFLVRFKQQGAMNPGTHPEQSLYVRDSGVYYTTYPYLRAIVSQDDSDFKILDLYAYSAASFAVLMLELEVSNYLCKPVETTPTGVSEATMLATGTEITNKSYVNMCWTTSNNYLITPQTLNLNQTIRWITDGTYNVGGASNKPNTIYATNGTINTSMDSAKNVVKNLNNAEEQSKIIDFLNHLTVNLVTMKNTSNPENPRQHAVFMSSNIREICQKLGLNTDQFAAYIREDTVKKIQTTNEKGELLFEEKEVEKLDENNRLIFRDGKPVTEIIKEPVMVEVTEEFEGLRYQEIFVLLVPAFQYLLNQNNQLKNEIDEIKAILDNNGIYA